MIEIFKIIIIFTVFLVFISGPLNIFNKVNKEIKINFLKYNLVINFNILLLLSLINIPIKNYQTIYMLILILLFSYSIFISKIDFKNFKKKNLINFSIIYFSFIVLALSISSNLNLGWDAKYFYYIKSLFFVEGLGLSELGSFEHNKWHPHFGSYLWAFFWSLPFIEIEYFGRLSYLFIFCFSIYFVTNFDSKNYLPNLLYIALLIILFKYERFSGLQEILIFSFLTISSKILYQLNFKKNLMDLAILVLIANLLIWIKAEGIAFGLIIILIILFNKKIYFREKTIIFLSFLFLIVLKYYVYSYYEFEANAQPYNFKEFILFSFENIYYRLEKIVIYLVYYSLKNPIFLIGIILIFFLNFYKKNKILLKNFNLYFIFNTVFIFSAYLFRDLEIVYSLKTTLERIVFTSSGFYVYLVILFINKIFEINKKKWKFL